MKRISLTMMVALFLASSCVLISCTEKKTTITTIKTATPEEQQMATYVNSLYQYYLFDISSFQLMKEKSINKELHAFGDQEIAMSKDQLQKIEAFALKNNIVLDSTSSDPLDTSLYKLTVADQKDFDRIFIADYQKINRTFTDSLTQRLERVQVPEMKILLQSSIDENNKRREEMQIMSQKW